MGRQAWTERVRSLRSSKASPDEYRREWECSMKDWNRESQGPIPMWFPEMAESDSESNIASFIRENGFASYDELHAWSISQEEDFWRAAIQKTNVHFAVQPTRILSTALGSENPRWLQDARVDIRETFLGGNQDRVGIVTKNEEGSIVKLCVWEIRQEVDRVASGLISSFGCKPGTNVALIMPMDADAVIAFLAIISIGCTVICIAESFAAPVIAERLDLANAQVVVCRDLIQRKRKDIALYERIVEAVGGRSIRICVFGNADIALREVDVCALCFKELRNLSGLSLLEPHQPLAILFSSGTTSEPKVIPWDVTCFLKCAIDGYYLQDVRAGDTIAWPTSLGWMMGIWLVSASFLNLAALALYTDSPTEQEFGEFVQDAGVTILGIVPTIVRAWITTEVMESFNFSAIRVFSSSGEVSNSPDMFYLSSLAGVKPVIEYLGGTEIAGGFVSSTLIHPNVPGAFAVMALGNWFTLLNDSGDPTESGEVFLRAPWLGMSTRLLNKNHHNTYFADCPSGPGGMVLRRHGDSFTKVGNNYYIACGRVDDSMNVGGIKISAAEIERIALRMDAVDECAAVSHVEVLGGLEELVLFVVCSTRKDEPLLRDFNKLIREHFSPLVRVARLVFRSSIPRNASNKIMRRTLREELATS